MSLRLSTLLCVALALTLAAAGWRLRRVPPHTTDPAASPPARHHSGAPENPSMESTLQRYGALREQPPRRDPAPPSNSTLLPDSPESPTPIDAGAAPPGALLGGLPLDGDELLALALPDVTALAEILRGAGVGPEGLKAHLRVAYGHIQRLSLFWSIADHAETDLQEDSAAAGHPPAGENDGLETQRFRASVSRSQFDEYQDYLRRAYARDFGITDEAVLQKAMELARPKRAEPGQLLMPDGSPFPFTNRPPPSGP